MKRSLSLAFLLALLWTAAPVRAAEQAGEDPAEKYFTNVELIDQDGTPRRLYDDLLEDKIIVINTIFTECTGVCPVMSKTMQRLQEHVGDRLGRDVHLLSITVDPANDSPQELKKMAARFDAQPGWYFLTGSQENVELALKKLGGYVADRDSHNTILIMGNLKTGLWKKALGLAASDKILPIFDSVLNDAGPADEEAR
mgnify:CR=1 FL=1